MLIYNITFHIEDSVHDNGLEFVKTVFIPLITAKESFRNPRLRRIHSVKGEEIGNSYALQLDVDTKEAVREWVENGEVRLLRAMFAKFDAQVMAFSALLEEIEF